MSTVSNKFSACLRMSLNLNRLQEFQRKLRVARSTRFSNWTTSRVFKKVSNCFTWLRLHFSISYNFKTLKELKKSLTTSWGLEEFKESPRTLLGLEKLQEYLKMWRVSKNLISPKNLQTPITSLDFDELTEYPRTYSLQQLHLVLTNL